MKILRTAKHWNWATQRRVPFGVAVLVLLLAVGASVALADEESGPLSGPSVSQVIEAIKDPSVRTVEMPYTDPLAAATLPQENLNRDQANELLTEVFGPAIEAPASIFDELDVLKFYSSNVALLEPAAEPSEGDTAESRPTLLESTLPLRAENAEGEQAPVDLGLAKEDGEIRPINPLVEVEIPSQLDEGISLPQSDIQIELANAPADRAPSIIDQSTAAYPNVAEDTTFVVAPTPTGMETFTVLQSPDAPTSQTFDLNLPVSAVLKETEDGGAEVSKNGATLMTIFPPSAMDAAEASVPVYLKAKNDSITITANPGPESLFPILVDPMWETYYWFQGTTTSRAGWSNFSNSPVFTTSHNGWHEGGAWAPGLQIASGNTAITPGAQARWDYRVPRWATDINSEGKPVRPSSFITRVIYSKLFFDVQESANNPMWSDPFFAFYIWDESYGSFVSIGHRWGHEGNLSNMSYEYNLYNTAPPNENVNAKQTSLELVSSQWKSQYRQLYVGLAGVELSDKDFPGLAPVIAPDDWLHTASKPIYFEAMDPGLGLREMTVTQPSINGGVQTFKTPYKTKSMPIGCSGGNMAPCPRDWTSTTGPAITYDPATMPQGENSLVVDAVDPLGQRATKKPDAKSDLGRIHIWVDHTTPDLALSGPLTEQGKIGTSAAEYAVSYSATDGDAQAPSVTSYIGSLGTGDGKLQRPQGRSARRRRKHLGRRQEQLPNPEVRQKRKIPTQGGRDPRN